MKQLELLSEKIAIRKPDHLLGFKDQSWARSKADVQNILDLYSATGLEALTPDEFDRLFNDTDALLYDKITGGSTHLVGAKGQNIEINKSTALNIIAKPKGYNDFIEALKAFETLCQEKYDTSDSTHRNTVSSAYYKKDITKYFLLTTEGVLDYTDTVKHEISDAGFFYISTKRGAAIHDFCNKLAGLYIECGLPEHFPFTDRPNPEIVTLGQITGLLKDHMRQINTETGEYKPLFRFGSTSTGSDYSADRNTYSVRAVDVNA